MGAFNTLQAIVICPVCEQMGGFAIQFKYGDTWQYEYHLGDEIRWGGNDIGAKWPSRVRIEGIAEVCPNCHTQWIEMDIISERNTVCEVIPIGLSRATESPLGFEYLE